MNFRTRYCGSWKECGSCLKETDRQCWLKICQEATFLLHAVSNNHLEALLFLYSKPMFEQPKTWVIVNGSIQSSHGHGYSGAFSVANCSTHYQYPTRLAVLPVITEKYRSTALCWALAAFSDTWSFTQSIGLLGWGISSPQGRCLHTGKHKRRIKSHKHPSFKWDSNPRSRVLSGLAATYCFVDKLRHSDPKKL
jgi:hypothetical protein